jgi:hypothetical protein
MEALVQLLDVAFGHQITLFSISQTFMST